MRLCLFKETVGVLKYCYIRLCTVSINLNNDKSPESAILGIMSEKDNATAEELIWSMKVANSHFSYASCDDIKETFEAMFPGAVPKNFSLSSSKVFYRISDAIGPYFHKMLIDENQIQQLFCFMMRPQMPSTSSSLIFKATRTS